LFVLGALYETECVSKRQSVWISWNVVRAISLFFKWWKHT